MPSASLCDVRFPSADDSYGAADEHHRQSQPHDAGDGHVHAGLNGGVVLELPQLLRDGIILIQLYLDDLAGHAVPFQRFNLADQVGAGGQAFDMDNAVLAGCICAQILAAFILQAELDASRGLPELSVFRNS